MFKRRRRIEKEGFPKYKGNAEQICTRIIERCWNGKYFQTSAGHFNEFYARDFGWCTRYLLELGQKEQVKQTLNYALDKYSKTGIKTAITPEGKPFNFPNYYCIDGVAYIFHAIRAVNDKELIEKYQPFLQEEIYKLEKEAIDQKTGMVKKNRYFSSMKDCSLRQSSCYDNTMIAFMDNELRKLKVFDNPLKKLNMKKRLKEEFWTGTYFKNDSGKDDTVTGDSNIIPVWTGVIKDKSMIKTLIATVEKEGLTRPFPLKYTHKASKEHKMIIVEKLARNWEQDSIWAMMGMMFIDAVSIVDKNKAKRYLKQYEKVIEKHKNFLEVFNREGKPFKTRWYACDDSMLWASMYLGLRKKLKQN